MEVTISNVAQYWYIMFFVLVYFKNLVVVVSVVLMDSPKSEIIEAPTSYYAFPHHISITVLLDFVVV
jgi:hypothetical protein